MYFLFSCSLGRTVKVKIYLLKLGDLYILARNLGLKKGRSCRILLLEAAPETSLINAVFEILYISLIRL